MSEFSPSTSSAMGLPAEFHEDCRSSFEKDYLQVYFAVHMIDLNLPLVTSHHTKFHFWPSPLSERWQKFYCWAQEAALGVTGEVLECRGDTSGDRVCSAALRFMFQVLNWEFKGSSDPLGMSNNKAKQDIALLRKFDLVVVQVVLTVHNFLDLNHL